LLRRARQDLVKDSGTLNASEQAGATRRAVLFDVENSSRPEHVAAVIDHLDLRLRPGVDFVAMGNWRVVGLDTARLLSRRGARLVHSAPAPGVKDWSDLRIAVTAGMWLGNARPGDVLEIVTDDQAFDAVGDVAATRGVVFRRLSYRSLELDGEHGNHAAAVRSRRRRRRPRHRTSGRSTGTR